MDREEFDYHHTRLAERAPNARCPMCGNTTWERTAVVSVVLVERVLGGDDPASTETAERHRPALALACEQCWFLRVHLTTSPHAQVGT